MTESVNEADVRQHFSAMFDNARFFCEDNTEMHPAHRELFVTLAEAARTGMAMSGADTKELASVDRTIARLRQLISLQRQNMQPVTISRLDILRELQADAHRRGSSGPRLGLDTDNAEPLL